MYYSRERKSNIVLRASGKNSLSIGEGTTSGCNYIFADAEHGLIILINDIFSLTVYG